MPNRNSTAMRFRWQRSACSQTSICWTQGIESHLQRASYQHGDVIFREGDPGGEVFYLTKGTASAFLQSPDGTIRLATFAPGTVFGELAILDGGQRSTRSSLTRISYASY